MKKMLLAVAVMFLIGFSVEPITKQTINYGFKNGNKKWGPKLVFGSIRVRMLLLQYGPATKDLERAIARFPSHPKADDAHFWLAVSYDKGGKPESALRNYRLFIARYPEHRWRDLAEKQIDHIFMVHADIRKRQ